MLNLARTIPTLYIVNKQSEHNNPRHDRCRTEDADDQTVITSNLAASSQDKIVPPSNENQPPFNMQQAQQIAAATRGQPEQAKAVTDVGSVRRMSQVCNTQKLTRTPRGELLPKFGSSSPPRHSKGLSNACKTQASRPVQMAISDSGATDHFLVEGAPAINIKRAKYPIKILLPNGKRIKSTHTCNLDIPWLPDQVT